MKEGFLIKVILNGEIDNSYYIGIKNEKSNLNL